MDKKNIRDILSLTPTQEGILYHYLKEPQRNLYYVQLCLETAGELDVHRFTAAWNFVVKTNEMLRASFRWEQVKAPLQIILKESSIELHYYDLSDKADSEKVNVYEEVKKQDRKRGFYLKDIPFRITLCKIDNALYQVIISHHHILYDGWSNGIILKEFFEAYNELSRGVPFNQLSSPVKTQFKEFVKWIGVQEEDEGKKAETATFWKDHLSGFEGESTIPLRRKKNPGMTDKDEYQDFCLVLEPGICLSLERFTSGNNITAAVLFYSTWGLLLQKYSNCNDVLFGTTVSGRSPKIAGIEDMVGLFVNTLPLRICFYPGETILDLLYKLNVSLQVRETHEHTPLVKVYQYCLGSANEAHFDSIVVVENYPLDLQQLQDSSSLTINSYSIMETPHYDITVVIRMSHSINIHFLYQGQVFDEESIKRLSSHFLRLLRVILENPHQCIPEIEMLSVEEKWQILEDFNNTDVDYPRDKTIGQLFMEQVKRTPDKIALLGPPQIKNRSHMTHMTYISYRQLNEKSHQLAHFLQEKGVSPGIIVGIMAARSLEMVIGILAILKAGGAYLPIDPEYPQERIDYMLKESCAGILLNGTAVETGKSEIRISKFETNPNDQNPNDQNKVSKPIVLNFKHLNFEFVSNFGFRASNLNSSNLAYIIYTSGSTGKPKGVMVEHGSAVNILWALQKDYPLTASDTYLLKTSYMFDVSVTELFGWFLGGGRLAILETDGERDPVIIMDGIERFVVTHINFVPSMFNVFLEEVKSQDTSKLSSLRYIFLAGEGIFPELVEKFGRLNTKIRLENIYGPTEGTVYSSQYSLCQWQGEGDIPIGKPMANIRLYIRDRFDHLQPVGVAGELCISGIGVARGYLNKPELTAERFKRAVISHSSLVIGDPNDQCPMTNDRSYKLYLTGDLARWLVDGNIEFLGRIDHQIKIRGFRIELGEIENQLLTHKKIKEAVVITRKDTHRDNYLCAYFVLNGAGGDTRGQYTDIEELREFLLHRLPTYMVPSFFICLEEIPLTRSGKIDRGALPMVEGISEEEFTAPRNEIEEKLVMMWAEVLGETGPSSIGIDDHFFHIGGHSLTAIKVISRIQKEFEIKVPLAEIFKTPTVRGLARYLKGGLKDKFIPIAAVEKKEYYPLSSSQKRLYAMQHIEQGSTVYNMQVVLTLEGAVDRAKMRRIFQQLILRHEILRTSFEVSNREPRQHILEEVEFQIEYQDLYITRVEVKVEDSEGTWGADITSSFIRPFDLSHPPLFRLGLFRLGPLRHLLLMDMHHIIFDMISSAILLTDFITLYEEKELPPLRLHYKDYSKWQQVYCESVELKKQEAYWLKQFSGDIPLLNLPKDVTGPVVHDSEGRVIYFEMDKETTDSLKHLAIEEDVTLYMVLLALYTILLGKISGQEEVIVGTPAAGRRHTDLESLVGFFVNTLALRYYPAANRTFAGFLAEVKATALEAYDNQDYPFEDLVSKVWNMGSSHRFSFISAFFAMQDKQGAYVMMRQLTIPGLTVTPYMNEIRKSPFDIILNCADPGETLAFQMIYQIGLFKEETVKRMIDNFHKITGSVLANRQVKLEDISLSHDLLQASVNIPAEEGDFAFYG